MSSAIVRQWMILSMLPIRPRRIDTSAIEARLRERGVDVHRRTIQRDLIELAEIFPIVADERAKPFGWRWSDEASFIARIPTARDQNTVDVTVRVPRTALAPLLQLVSRVESAEVISPPH
jgi:hypothetical protein